MNSVERRLNSGEYSEIGLAEAEARLYTQGADHIAAFCAERGVPDPLLLSLEDREQLERELVALPPIKINKEPILGEFYD